MLLQNCAFSQRYKMGVGGNTVFISGKKLSLIAEAVVIETETEDFEI
jgi:hypothetical protein